MRLPVAVAEIAEAPSIPASPDPAIEEALHARPEILLLEQNVIAARAGISLARAQSQPAVNARGQVTEQTPRLSPRTLLCGDGGGALAADRRRQGAPGHP